MPDLAPIRDRLSQLTGRPLPEILDTPLADLAADSFGFVEFLLELEEDYGLRLTEAEMGAVETVADLLRAVEGRLAAAA